MSSLKERFAGRSTASASSGANTASIPVITKYTKGDVTEPDQVLALVEELVSRKMYISLGAAHRALSKVLPNKVESKGKYLFNQRNIPAIVEMFRDVVKEAEATRLAGLPKKKKGEPADEPRFPNGADFLLVDADGHYGAKAPLETHHALAKSLGYDWLPTVKPAGGTAGATL